MKNKNLLKLLDNFPNKRIAVIGDVMLDIYVFGDNSRKNPEAPGNIFRENDFKYSVGGAGNVALNISSLGGEVSLFGFIGDDLEGKILQEKLKEKGIDFYFDLKNQTTSKKRLIVYEPNLPQVYHQILRIDREDSSNKKFSKKVKEKMIQEIQRSDIVLISDYAKGVVNGDLMNILNFYLDKTIIDPKPKNKRYYSNAFLITPNKKEALEMSYRKTVEASGRYLRDNLNSNILITLGPEGMALFSKEDKDELLIPTHANKKQDITGAGDSAVAGISLAIASGGSLKEAIIIGNHTAGIAVGNAGTYNVKLNELEKVLRGESKKRVNLSELENLVRDYKNHGKKVVFTSGCFDILHPGHIKFLNKAKSYGDVLVLALNGDKSPFFKTKGNNRPILNEKERIDVLSGLESVDYITTFNEENPLKLLEKLKPDVKVKGGSYIPERVSKEDEIVKSYGGECKYVDMVGEYSTTKLIKKIKENI